MSQPRIVRILFIAALALFGFAPSLALAQGATPAAAPAGTIVASGLTNPRGVTWGADGTLFVALAGSGRMASNDRAAAEPAAAGANELPAVGPGRRR